MTGSVSTSKVEMAYNLFEAFSGVGGNFPMQYQKAVEYFYAEYNDIPKAEIFEAIGDKDVQDFCAKFCDRTKSELFKAIADLCNNDNSIVALYTKANALSFAGAKYRQETIKALTEYLSGESFFANLTYNPIIEYPDGTKVRRSDALQAAMYAALGSAYDGEYDYENSLSAYKESYRLCPSLSSDPILIEADIYRKRNNLDAGISLLKKSINSIPPNTEKYNYYKSRLDDLIDKQQKGYVYRPKNKKAYVMHNN